MGCFPGTQLPCLKNALAAQPQIWVQPCPGCSCAGGSDPGAPQALSRAGSSSQCPQTGKEGDISPAKQSICCWWNRNCEQDFEGRLFFPAAYNNVTVRFSATVSRTQPRSLRTMARLPFLSWLLEFCCISPQRSIFLSILEIMCIVALLLEKTGSKSSWARNVVTHYCVRLTGGEMTFYGVLLRKLFMTLLLPFYGISQQNFHGQHFDHFLLCFQPHQYSFLSHSKAQHPQIFPNIF